jgi:hypothetical protein
MNLNRTDISPNPQALDAADWLFGQQLLRVAKAYTVAILGGFEDLV